MSTVSTFEQSLQGTADSCRRVAPDEVAGALVDLIEEPAVGVSLPFDGATLPEGVTVDPTAEELRAARTGVTPAGMGIADYGTVTVRSTPDGDELVSLYPPTYVAVLAAGDVVPDMPAAFARLAEEFDAGRDTQVLVTGPSSTADMGTLVQGVHGPENVHVVLIEGS